MEHTAAFTLQIRPDNIAVVTIDVPEEKMNTLKAAFVGEVRGILELILQNRALEGVIFISGKPDNFIAGADINMISGCKSAQQAEALARQGQQIMGDIRALTVPVVAAIHGPCLGGGLELALACHYRVCSDDDATRLGLPEVQLGLLPGSGGTQRLPRLIGVRRALEMMLTAKSLRPRQALKVGLVDDVVPQAILLDAAVALVKKGRRVSRSLSLSERALAGPLGRAVLFRMVAKQVLQKTHGNYPAPERIMEVVRTGLTQGMRSGLDAEAQAFGELAMTPQSEALRSLFFACNEVKKDPGSTGMPRPVETVGLLGGGLMGGGIAYVTAVKGNLPVRIKDISEQGINHALKYTWDLLDKKVRCRHLRPQQRAAQMALISGTTDYSGFRQRDVVIEAVFEDLDLKRQMVAEVERSAAAYTVFASNTSSLSIAEIAAGAQRPEQVIGLHFFSPVDKMPLVEVIPHARTSQETIATIVALAKKLGKTPIVVGDVAGFYVNRILAPYINEALRCVMEGERVETVDRALVKFGFPVGPLQLLDEVGIDVGTKIIPLLEQAYGDRFSAPDRAVTAILQDNRKGRKNGRGFYLYPAKGRAGSKRVDPAIYPLIGVTPGSRLAEEEISQRCVMMMLNEAARCLEEGVIRSVRDGDIGAVFGIGFPPFTGGPFRYMDRAGAAGIVAVLQRLATAYGERFSPCDALLRMAERQQTYWSDESQAVTTEVEKT